MFVTVRMYSAVPVIVQRCYIVLVTVQWIVSHSSEVQHCVGHSSELQHVQTVLVTVQK